MADTRPVVDREERGRTDRARASCRENPALIVSGGGRCGDAAVTLVEQQVRTARTERRGPSDRPTAHKIT
ncbi:hypothetical protein [Streptomyces sp. NBC_01602]|uniref:hypothetical protein n=1 Tax=Streptomyces sp. NBC_01602 TaxID=2975893 RepID=UPI0038655CE1